jgi:hypothetical protein
VRAGYEANFGTDTGNRNVAKHNVQIRLATVLFAMLQPLQSPPAGFERAVQAHFYYKRDEVKAQLAQWVAEVQAMAAYDHVVQGTLAEAKARYKALVTAEVAALGPAPPPPTVGGKRSRGARAHGYPTYDHHAAIQLPPHYTKSAAVLAAERDITTVSSTLSGYLNCNGFTVMAGGISTLPRGDTSSYAPGATAGTGHASGLGGTSGVRLSDWAGAMQAAVADVCRELDRLKEPEMYE